MILYVTLLVIIAAAVVATVYLKRASEQSWRRYQRRRAFARLAAASVTLTASTAAFSAGLRSAAQAAADFDRAMARLRATLGQERDQ